MKKLLLLLAVLLASSPASAVVDEFVVVVLCDDCSRAMAEYSNVGNNPDWITGGAPAVTTAIDDIKAAGFSSTQIKTSAVCSPTRVRLLDYGPTGVSSNQYGKIFAAFRPENSPTQINPGFANLVREAQAAGFQVAFFGKRHMATHSEEGDSWEKKMGFDYAKAVTPGNIQGTLPGVDYSVGAVGDIYENCKGHNLWYECDLDNNCDWTRRHTTDAVFTEADIYMAAQSSGKHLIIIEPIAPHTPTRPGDASLICDGNTVDQNDWPPGFSNPTDGTTSEAVYIANMEYLSTRLGTLIADNFFGGAFTRDTVMIFSDNGTPATNNVLPECVSSLGMKGTPYVCGTTTFFAAAGPGIIANKTMTSRLLQVEDITATLLALMGGSSVHPWGLNFLDCMKELNSQTALSCRHTRDSVEWTEWDDIGGVAGLITRPPRITDPANTWESWEVASEVFLDPAKPHVILHRVYDTTVSPMTFTETYWPINDGVFEEMYVKPATQIAGAVGLIPEDGTGWLVTATDGLKEALVFAHGRLEHQFDRNGNFQPTYGGF